MAPPDVSSVRVDANGTKTKLVIVSKVNTSYIVRRRSRRPLLSRGIL